MSLGFGRVAPQDWDGLKSGGLGGDRVDPGEYIVQVGETRHLEPSEKSKGQGVYFTKLKITERNAAFVGKTLERGFRYHPNPPSDGITQMNAISEQDMAKLIDVCGMTPVVGPDGMFDLIASLKMLGQVGASCKCAVTHRTDNGKVYQDVGQFAPLM